MAVNALERRRRTIIASQPHTETATGALVTISNGSKLPVQSCLSAIEPVQAGSGDPSPSNIRPITGHTGLNVVRTGKNLDPYNNLNNSTRLWGRYNDDQIKVFKALPVGTYTMSCKFTVLTNPGDEATVNIGVLVRYSDNGSYVIIIPQTLTSKPATVGAVYEWNYTFTISESLADKDSLYVYFYCAYGGQSTTTANAYDIQIESGSTSTSYEPYNGQTTEAHFPVLGKNVMPAGEAKDVTYSGIRFISDGQGKYTITGTSTGGTSCTFLLEEPFTIPTSENYKVCFMNNVGASGVAITFMNGDSAVDAWGLEIADKNNSTYQTMGGKACDRIRLSVANANQSVGMTLTPMLIPKNDPIVWEPYNTVYGGTLDVKTGVLTVDRAMVDLGTLTWSHSPSNRSRCSLSEIKNPTSASTLANCIAEGYKQVTANNTLNVGEYAISGGYLIFYYDGTNEPTGKLVYELATPLIYQLTPQEVKTLSGINNIWSDTGNITLTYWTH